MKENLDEKINFMSENTTTFEREGMIPNQSSVKVSASSSEQMSALFEKLNQCQIKPVVLSVVEDHADQFVAKSRTVPVVSDLFQTENLELDYPGLHC